MLMPIFSLCVLPIYQRVLIKSQVSGRLVRMKIVHVTKFVVCLIYLAVGQALARKKGFRGIK